MTPNCSPSAAEIRQEVAMLPITPWHGANWEGISLTVVTGGLTNALYCARMHESPDTPSSSILVRVFGVSDGLLNRELENEIFTFLSDKGISPKLIGTTSWGRFEEFLAEHKPLPSGLHMIKTGPDVDIVALIARALSDLHKVEIHLDRELASADIFEVMRKWLSLAERYADRILPSPTLPELFPPSIEALSQEIEFIATACLKTLRSHAAVERSSLCQELFRNVLCHNDLLSGNLMFNEREQSLRLIDFEYSGYNYAVADIANMFCAVCESILIAGEPQDVKRTFPSPAIQLHTLKYYFGHAIPADQEDALLAVISGFAMADELRWTIWNVIQENQSTIEFDYCRCYNSRFNAYLDYKQMFTDRLARLV